ncbi:nuclear autoantigenic sperm protein [Tribolium castaneum]|uniref:Nuclear autoantigenic sperm protein-like Protein n=1 Tax=Tribolium castaneum TaxID=7070 RepID=D2A552_TRICA|nr:PREDICTED: nuclear autoantigenic sperm protein [Tribolium castaneum]XP_970862.2 PREDICTED: nuclear autoantigenic sperm protein [Tribolium castaneum]EFA05316.2 Nuclear autoantigenic sperm protein-like Protein [Tribolium castaneum]|eukprot:XP_008194592.1 PREDICTED: nuclear autoantigenic sperm protein [Tribolium castaneum]
MADVALDPQNSNPKELFGQGVRAYVLQDFDTAVKAFSKASELLAAEHGSDVHDSLGDVYLYYGKSLLELSRKESGPLGDGVLKNVEEESETEDVEENEAGEEESKPVNGETPKTEEEDDKPPAEGETDQKVEESGSSEEKKEGEETEDELTDLQVAWEVLELAKRIFTNRGTEGKKNLAETLIVLGEISLESGNFTSAIEDMTQGLEIQKTLFGNDSRTIAETCYKLGGAYSTNGQIDEAIASFNSSYEYLQNKITSLKKDEKESNSEEIEELNGLIPEIQEKIADMKNLKTEIANKMTSSVEDETAPKTNGSAGASSSKQVNDISHLVKRKRKEDEAKEENPAKRPSP